MAITTNREYLSTLLNRFGLTSDDIELIMVENPVLEGNLDVKACKEAMYKSFSAVLNGNISESGFSVTWDIERLKLWYNSLCIEIGKPNAIKPKIRNRSHYW
jgi:hypothetical protein